MAPSQEIREAANRAKLKVMAGSRPGLLPDVGKFGDEATEKTKKAGWGELFQQRWRQSLENSEKILQQEFGEVESEKPLSHWNQRMRVGDAPLLAGAAGLCSILSPPLGSPTGS